MKKLLRSKINQRVFKSMKKIGVMFLVLLFSSGIYFMGGTNAFQTDNEETIAIMESGRLDLEVSSSDAALVLASDANDFGPGKEVSRQATVSNNGTMDIKYKVAFEKISGDNDLCDALQLIINDGSADIYNGELSSLDYEFLAVLGVGSNNNYSFKVSLPSDADESLENLSCGFNFVFTGWQSIFADNTQGWSDEEKIVDNLINTGEWLSEGDVVINEVMWMGSDDSTADEWIELKNMTDNPINLKNWDIYGAVSGGSGHLEIAHGVDAYIPANGFLLIANKDKDYSDLDVNVDVAKTNISLQNNYNTNGALILKDKDGNMIDATPIPSDSDWPAGENGSSTSDYRSMQRKLVPGDGTDENNWFTINHPAANDTDYWDDEINNYGTPGSENLLPIVLNEFLANPTGTDTASMPDGEFIELWNNDSEDWDVDGWIISNGHGDEIEISVSNGDNDDNTSDDGETIVPDGGSLAVYVNGQFSPDEFFDNDSDGKLYLYAKYGDLKTKNDYYDYLDPSGFGEDKAYQRIPDGNGPWTDPDPTPGEENKLNDDEEDYYRELVFEKCFDGREFDREEENPLCKGIFLEYLGLLDDQYDDEMPKDVYNKMLEIIADPGEIKDQSHGASDENGEVVSMDVSTTVGTQGDTAETEDNGEEELLSPIAKKEKPKEVSDGGEVSEEIFIEKEIGIDFSGEPKVNEGLEIEIEKKIKKAFLRIPADSVEELEAMEVDLSKLEFDKEGNFEFAAKDLLDKKAMEDEEIDLIEPEKDAIVLEVEVFSSEKIIEVEVSVSGKLSLEDGLEIEKQKLKIKEIEVSGWEEEENEIEIDLSGLDKADKAGVTEIKIKDLDLPKEAEVVSHKKNEVVLKIEIASKEEDDEEAGDEEEDEEDEEDEGEEEDEEEEAEDDEDEEEEDEEDEDEEEEDEGDEGDKEDK